MDTVVCVRRNTKRSRRRSARDERYDRSKDLTEVASDNNAWITATCRSVGQVAKRGNKQMDS